MLHYTQFAVNTLTERYQSRLAGFINFDENSWTEFLWMVSSFNPARRDLLFSTMTLSRAENLVDVSQF